MKPSKSINKKVWLGLLALAGVSVAWWIKSKSDEEKKPLGGGAGAGAGGGAGASGSAPSDGSSQLVPSSSSTVDTSMLAAATNPSPALAQAISNAVAASGLPSGTPITIAVNPMTNQVTVVPRSTPARPARVIGQATSTLPPSGSPTGLPRTTARATPAGAYAPSPLPAQPAPLVTSSPMSSAPAGGPSPAPRLAPSPIARPPHR